MHEKILDALRRGAHEEALALARAAIDADQGDATAHRLMAQALRLGDDQPGALEAIDRAIALSPDDADLHFHRAGLLLGSRDLEQARQVLDQAIELNPNQLGAYVMQAELALGRGDLDEAERLVRVAERIAPGHPLLQSTEAMVALRRGDKGGALSLVTAALEQAPDAPQVLNAAAFIYLGNDYLAFAEQAFRRLLELKPGHHGLRRALAELLYRQGRPADALGELTPLLEVADGAMAESRRFAGELALRLGDPARALDWLRGALAAMPGDLRSLELAMQAWSRLGDFDGARNALEALLSTSPQMDVLWRARMSVETEQDAARAVLGRWHAARPDSVQAHDAQARLQMADGDQAGAEATLRRILELAPGHMPAVGRLADLLATRDPGAAVEFVRERLDHPGQSPEQRQQIRGWLALANDAAGDFADAARAWGELHAEVAKHLIPLPEATAADAQRKPTGQIAVGAPPIAFLAGMPGSAVEYVARLLESGVPAFRSDRIRGGRPQDPLQNLHTISGIANGSIDPAEVVAQWRAALPARGTVLDGPVIDWLLWWDNALLDMIRPHLPQARILLALRDPRDMLLNWLAFGTPVPFRLGTPQEGARWLAGALEHVAMLEEKDLHPHAILRLDDVVNDPQAMAKLVGGAVGVDLPVPPPGLFQGRRFQAGRWRQYADALHEPFAILAPVAVRLGYPET